jgi:glutaminase
MNGRHRGGSPIDEPDTNVDSEEAARSARTYVSTGSLPPSEVVSALVKDAHERFKSNTEGRNSDVYPSLAAVPSDLFGICVVGANGALHAAGDWDRDFTIMSVSKPFVFALVCQAIGAREAHARLGVNATGLPFNSLEALERAGDGRTNPMVNSGAIATTSLMPGANHAEKWRRVREGLSRFAARDLSVDHDVYACALESNARNRAIGRLLQAYGRIYADPEEAIDLYTMQCALRVNAKDLAVMGATLADGGVNPLSKERVIDADICRFALAVMATAGLYETSGDWLYQVGLPGKSGVGGGIVTVAPGKGGLGSFSPRLDAAGNSVKGQLAARYLSDRLGLSLFASKAET